MSAFKNTFVTLGDHDTNTNNGNLYEMQKF